MFDIDAVMKELKSTANTPANVFWSFDPHLPLLAAKAAVEFDWLFQGKVGKSYLSLNAIKLLSSLLTGSIGKITLAGGAESFCDPLGVCLFAEAYNQVHDEAAQVKSKSELIPVATVILDTLKRTCDEAETVGTLELENMRDFCVALSERAAIYRMRIYGNRRGRHYRR
jgi:hypothetical protein